VYIWLAIPLVYEHTHTHTHTHTHSLTHTHTHTHTYTHTHIHTHTHTHIYPHNLEVSINKIKFISTMKLGADELPNYKIRMHV